MDAVTTVPTPANEPTLHYAPGSPERAAVTAALGELTKQPIELTTTIGGEQRVSAGAPVDVVQPHNHRAVLGTFTSATEQDARDAIAAAKAAAPAWRALSFDDRAAILLRAADLLTGPWRAKLNAATMLGQSKTVFQAEIDAACELADFWRFNVHFGRRITAEQPNSSPGVWNRMDHRPLEGFVYAITPFNFTAIAANLPTAPALMGNTVLWKPSPTQMLSAHLTMRLLEAAGLPAGVINLLPGDGIAVSNVALASPDLAGIHFTGSTATFQHLWSTVGANIAGYRAYPRLVGETGGKDFVLAHPSADPDVLRTALIRGAFEYQGQKCSAASRAYVPRSVWERMRDNLVSEIESISVGDVADFTNFMGAVIDRRAFDRLCGVLDRARADTNLTILTGGTADDSEGYFVRPTVAARRGPRARGVPHRVLRPAARRARLRGRRLRPGAAPARRRVAVRADRLDHRDRPRRHRARDGRTTVHRRQLLRQRQADRRGRRPAALRRRARVGHQRQGGRHAQPAALGLAEVDQGDVRSGHRLPLPAPGVMTVLASMLHAAARSTAARSVVERSPLTRPVVRRFIAGDSVTDAIDTTGHLLASGLLVTLDHLGEDTTSAEAADATVRAYQELLKRLADKGFTDRAEVSVKLSAVGQQLDAGLTLDNARRICVAADEVGATVTLDMEDHTTTDATLTVLHELRRDFPWVGAVLQAYLRRTEGDCRDLATAGSRIRLCKGAYAEPASVAFATKPEVDLSYVRCLKVLMAGSGYPMVASHDPRLIAIAGKLAADEGRNSDSFEYQMLYGIRPAEQQRLANEGNRIRVYLPYGTQWYGYFMRRLAERPANLTFFLRSLATKN